MTERIDIVMDKEDGQKYGFRTENTTIVKSDEGSVSYNAGVRIGDRLVKINDTTIGDDFNINQLANHISESGNSLKVTIERKTVISEEILTEVDGKKIESEVQDETKTEKKGLFGIGKMFAKKGDKKEETERGNIGEIYENKLDGKPAEKKPKKEKREKKPKTQKKNNPQPTENPVQLPEFNPETSGNWFSKIFGSKKTSEFSPNGAEGEITAQAPISVGPTLSTKKIHFSSENLADPEIFIQGMEGGRPRACWSEIQKIIPEEDAERIENEGEDGYFSADLGTLKALSARQSKKIIKMRSLENRFEMKASFVNSL